MCGRYTLSRTEEILQRFQIEPNGVQLEPRYNIAPDAIMPVVVRGERNRIEMMKWGLVPSWSKDGKSLAINARIETLLSKPSFRRPIRQHRCLIPATGFYEWKKETSEKTPYHIRRKDGGLFAFAGIYDRWKNPQDGETASYAILTTAPNPLMAAVHNRMPVILDREQELPWLSAAPEETETLLASLAPLSENQIELYPVSRRVNWAGNDGPELIRPA